MKLNMSKERIFTSSIARSPPRPHTKSMGSVTAEKELGGVARTATTPSNALATVGVSPCTGSLNTQTGELDWGNSDASIPKSLKAPT